MRHAWSAPRLPELGSRHPGEPRGPAPVVTSSRRIDVDKRRQSPMSESENPAIPAPSPHGNRPRTNQDWWPDQLDLSVLHRHAPHDSPMGEAFDYAEAFAGLDIEALRRDVV